MVSKKNELKSKNGQKRVRKERRKKEIRKGKRERI